MLFLENSNWNFELNANILIKKFMGAIFQKKDHTKAVLVNGIDSTETTASFCVNWEGTQYAPRKKANYSKFK